MNVEITANDSTTIDENGEFNSLILNLQIIQIKSLQI